MYTCANKLARAHHLYLQQGLWSGSILLNLLLQCEPDIVQLLCVLSVVLFSQHRSILGTAPQTHAFQSYRQHSPGTATHCVTPCLLPLVSGVHKWTFLPNRNPNSTSAKGNSAITAAFSGISFSSNLSFCDGIMWTICAWGLGVTVNVCPAALPDFQKLMLNLIGHSQMAIQCCHTNMSRINHSPFSQLSQCWCTILLSSSITM